MSIHPPGLGELTRRRFAAVLFDLDGTLIDSTPAVLRAWHRWSTEHGYDGFPVDVPHGVPARQVLATFLPAEQIEAGFERLEELEVSDTEGVTVLPGAAEALRVLSGHRTAIVTSGTPRLAAARIAASGLAVPPLVITADDVTSGKPDPEPFLLAAARLGVDPADCLVVEDAVAGLTAGRDAGCATLAVTTSHDAGELDADALVDSLADVRFVVTGQTIALTAS